MVANVNNSPRLVVPQRVGSPSTTAGVPAPGGAPGPGPGKAPPLEVSTLGTGGQHPGLVRPTALAGGTGKEARPAGTTVRQAGLEPRVEATPRFQLKFSTADASFDSTRVTLFNKLQDVAPKSQLKPATDAQVRALARELTTALPGLFANMKQWAQAPGEEPAECAQKLGSALKDLATQPMVATILSDGNIAPGLAVKVGLKALGLSGRLVDTGDLAREMPELLGFLNEALPIMLGQMGSIGSFPVDFKVEDLLPRVGARMLAAWMGFKLSDAQTRTLQDAMDKVTPSYASAVPEFFARRSARGTFDESFSAMALAMTQDLSHALHTLEGVRGRVNPSSSLGWLTRLFQ